MRFEVEETAVGGRLDRFLAGMCPDLSRARLQGLIRDGLVTRNGAATKASEIVRWGDLVEITLPTPTPMEGLSGRKMDLAILAEDAALLVLNKPAGVVVHPGAGTGEDTLVHGLLHYCQDLSGIGGVERPGIVHRLDKETSGCLVVAKTDVAHRELSRQFAEREVKKVYLAVVRGRPRCDTGTVVARIGRHPVHRQKMTVVDEGKGRAAETEWRVVAEGEKCSLVACHPRTGRTHQIRVHLKHLGHPILGDPMYGERGPWERHWLHAWKIGLRHPVSGEWRDWEAPVPSDFPLLPPAEA
jgi:23S rRNA pseudouridine1911/1915/1917 synthase